MDNLGILSPDINDRVDIRPEEMGPHGMAGKLTHLLISNAFRPAATLLPGVKARSSLFMLALSKDFGNGTGRSSRASPNVHEGLGDNVFAILEDDAFDAVEPISIPGIDTHSVKFLLRKLFLREGIELSDGSWQQHLMERANRFRILVSSFGGFYIATKVSEINDFIDKAEFSTNLRTRFRMESFD